MKKPLRRYYLNPEEYAKIISEINTNFDNYSNSRFGIHYSYGIDGTPYCYDDMAPEDRLTAEPEVVS